MEEEAKISGGGNGDKRVLHVAFTVYQNCRLEVKSERACPSYPNNNPIVDMLI